jgi:hypothetical protein
MHRPSFCGGCFVGIILQMTGWRLPLPKKNLIHCPDLLDPYKPDINEAANQTISC